MQLFDGSSKKKRQINLGGASAGRNVRSTGDILSSAAQERTQRLKRREQETAALKIQSFYRGRVAALSNRRKIQELPEDVDPIVLTRLAVVGNDRRRAELAFKRLLPQSTFAASQNPFWRYFTRGEFGDRMRWNFLTKRLCALLIRSEEPIPQDMKEHLRKILFASNNDPDAPATEDRLRLYVKRSTLLYLAHKGLLQNLYSHYGPHTGAALELTFAKHDYGDLGQQLFGVDTLPYVAEPREAAMIIIPAFLISCIKDSQSLTRTTAKGVDMVIAYLRSNVGYVLHRTKIRSSRPSTVIGRPEDRRQGDHDDCIWHVSDHPGSGIMACTSLRTDTDRMSLSMSALGDEYCWQPALAHFKPKGNYHMRIDRLVLLMPKQTQSLAGSSKRQVYFHELTANYCVRLLSALLVRSTSENAVSMANIIAAMLALIEPEVSSSSGAASKAFENLVTANHNDSDDIEPMDTTPPVIYKDGSHRNSGPLHVSGTDWEAIPEPDGSNHTVEVSASSPSHEAHKILRSSLRTWTRPASRSFASLSSSDMLSVITAAMSAAERFPSLLGMMIQSFSKSDIMRPLWRGALSPFLKTTEATSNRLFDAQLCRNWAGLTSFSSIMGWNLLATNDDEFNDPTRFPLEISDCIDLVHVLKQTCLSLQRYHTKLQLEENSSPTRSKLTSTVILSNIPFQSLLRGTTSVIKLLHDRSSTRPFVEPEAFTIKSPDMTFDPATLAKIVLNEERLLERKNSDEVTGGPGLQFSVGETASFETRLAVLKDLPFLIPFSTRVEVFRAFIQQDQGTLPTDQMRAPWERHGVQIRVRRSFLFADGYSALNGIGGQKLKKRIGITFIDEHGMEEAGIDGGGMFKEFMLSLGKQAMNPGYGLFSLTEDQALYPNPDDIALEGRQLKFLEFIGRMVGKALYDGILLDLRFATFFLSKWLGKRNQLDDLKSLDPKLYKGLLFLKNYQQKNPNGDVSDLALNFTTQQDDFLKGNRTVELVPDGENIPVCNDNVLRYIFLVANDRMNKRIENQCRAFFRGLSDLIDARWLRLFNEQELTQLLGGTESEQGFDIQDLRKNCAYGPNGDESHPLIRTFWHVLETFSPEEKQQFLKFVTSCSRPPILGFRELFPTFCVQLVPSGPEIEAEAAQRLPTASTCVNLLKLPMYSDEATMRSKLLYAISSGAGFDLS